jgi:hypothetical protein
MSLSAILRNVLLCSAALAVGMAGCGSDDESGGATSGGTTSGGCEPNAACQEYVGTTSECLALTDNSAAPTAGLRMSQLTITQPAVLATGAVAGIVGSAVKLDIDDCNLKGSGTFSWLLQFDNGVLKTGGAKPVTDPRGGFCFVNEMVGGQTVAPILADATVGADGSFSAAMGLDVVVPIYLDAAATSVVLLPLNQARLFNGKLSADKNCIGAFNGKGLDPQNLCLPDEEAGVFSFENGAELEGFITLEQADSVIVDTLGQTLCVLLSGDASQYGTDAPDGTKVCARDANMGIIYQGDWCSTTNAAADASCKDAVKLGAKFAASAVKITGDCN